MKRISLHAPLALAALALVLAPAAARAGEHRDLEERFPYEKGQRVRIDFPVGELRIEAVAGDEVRVELRAECRWNSRRCEDSLGDVQIVSRSSDRRLLIEVDGGDSWGRGKLELEGTIKVPRAAELDIEMGVGSLEIADFEGDVRVDMGVGEVKLRTSESRVRSVNLDAGIGEATLTGLSERLRGRRSLLIGAEVFWDEGPGEARIVIDLGIGDVSVRLD